MLWWLDDNVVTVYILVAIVGVIAGCAWWVTRRRGLLITVAVCAALLVLAWGIERLVTTDREQIESIVYEMRDGVLEGDTNKVYQHMADDFKITIRGNTLNKQAAIQTYGGQIKDKSFQEIHIFNYDTEELSRPNAVIFFRTRVDSRLGSGLWAWRAWFVYRNNRWKMQKIEDQNLIANNRAK